MYALKASEVDYSLIEIHRTDEPIGWAIDADSIDTDKRDTEPITLCKNNKWHFLMDVNKEREQPNGNADIYKSEKEAKAQFQKFLKTHPAHLVAYATARMKKGVTI